MPRLCECGRPAVFVKPSWDRVITDADHDLCPRCHRDLVNAQVATRLPDRIKPVTQEDL